MEVQPYQKYEIVLKFTDEICFTVNPVFLIRSMLGYNLRKLCCLSRKSVCTDCLYNKNCMYSWLFESIVPKDNEAVQSRDRASHPYVIYTDEKINFGVPCRFFHFYLILLGKSTKYLPYIYASLVKAGEHGLDRKRISFKVESITVDGKNIIHEDYVLPDIENKTWTFVPKPGFCGEILVQLLTPLRFKAAGKYTADFSARDFFLCLSRRLSVLCRLYGEYDEEKYFFPDGDIVVINAALSWTDSKHYSARQKKQINLGGIVGTFTLNGKFSEKELALLEFAKIFSAGKNTNFGLGRLDYWIREKKQEVEK